MLNVHAMPTQLRRAARPRIELAFLVPGELNLQIGDAGPKGPVHFGCPHELCCRSVPRVHGHVVEIRHIAPRHVVIDEPFALDLADAVRVAVLAERLIHAQ